MEYHVKAVLKSSEKGDVQLVEGDEGRLYVRRYREISPELFRRIQSVSCPFVERLTERSADENGAFFVSEYIEGTSVCECSLSEREALRALLELCAAMKALHRVGVIHRDIKPSNIILGADGHIRLIDFDSARTEIACQSRDTEILGTEGFAPPEQYGFMQTDSRSDIYAFGVTMGEILGESADKPKFRRIINRCTRFDPERRFSDIGAVKRAIKRAAMPNFAPLAAAVILLAAGILLINGEKPHSSPPGLVKLSETEEAAATTESEAAAPTEEVTTEEQTKEPMEEPTQEPPQEPTTEPLPTTTEPTEPENEPPAEPPRIPTSEPGEIPTETSAPPTEETAPTTAETTAESLPEPPETTEPERAPNILSDSVNPNKMPFETVQDEDGLYGDVFEYVFYDDPAVHGEWRLCGLLSEDTDFTAITAEELAFTGTFEGFMWQYLSVFEDGSCILRAPDKSALSRLQWTNGYWISTDNGRSFVRRMFEVTVDGVEYLMFEQKPTGNHPHEIPHRFLVYRRT